jgi:hypothetical protein
VTKPDWLPELVHFIAKISQAKESQAKEDTHFLKVLN